MHRHIPSEDILSKMDSSLTQYLFKQREEKFIHASLNEELSLFTPVLEGDINGMHKKIVQHRKKQLSVLSDSPLQNEKFYFVAMITTCCRLCIEAGMSSEESFGLSDIYIRKMDKCETADAVRKMQETMLLDYTERMHGYKTSKKQLSPKILMCINYIQSHLHDRITVKILADELEMNVSWLSTLFAREVGISVSEYVRREKIGAAKYLLSYNDYSCTDIAEYLGFATESHFSTQFAKLEGMSPKEYRRKQFQQTFTSMKEHAGNSTENKT